MNRKGWDALTPAYRQRLERARITRADHAAGVSLGKARGHARFSVAAAGRNADAFKRTDGRIASAVDDMAKGMSLSRAAKVHRIAPERLRREGQERGWIGKDERKTRRGQWSASRTGGYAPVLASDGSYRRDVPFNIRNMQVIGSYWYAFQEFFKGDTAAMRKLGSVEVVDVAGNRYRLLTDTNELRAYLESLTQAERDALGEGIGYERKVA